MKKKQFQVGDRVFWNSPYMEGKTDKGTVTEVSQDGKIFVKWDSDGAEHTADPSNMRKLTKLERALR